MFEKKSAAIKTFQGAIASNNITRVSNLFLSVAVVLSLITLFFKDAEVIAIPEQNMFGELSIQGQKANQNYQQAWAYSTATLIGNLNPQNVKFVTKTLMNMLSPNLQLEIEPMLNSQAEMIKMRDIRQVFIVEDLMHEPTTDLISVWGQKITFIGGEPKADTKWSYEFKVLARNGRPKITHIDQYPGTPRKRKQAMDARGSADPTSADAKPYYDKELEIGVLEAARDLQQKESKDQ
ncbi:TraE/TraK family type IV conjugative transfer system protein [uncultured Pseudoalteromonas sp.]|uniref:TraE/TraK family type IV conjugative transfer system protein n=1 Tax=uncultured Pseudoalteromonas sp. TaxID=114053 RepID=UPI0025936C09|nr:TraE/TraK family type IV conjugative transfer system protein [uncultured Pseudoalteromonas sp.]